MKRTSSSSSAWPLRRLLLLPVVVAALVSSGRADPNAAAVEGFKFEVVSGGDCGDGERRVKKGDVVEVHYTGRLTDENGAKFDSSRDRGGEPIKYQTGANQVIRGWELGVEGMCVGEKRRLTIPPELGYGDRGAGEAVPPGATLFFEIELVSVADGGSVENVFKLMDADGDNVLTREELTEYIDREMDKMKTQMPEEELSQLEGNKNSIIEEIFKHDDSNRDGVISHDEFSGPKHDEL